METPTTAAQPAPQPGLRSFIIYDHIPRGCISVEVETSENSDHIRRGEFAIVDPADREPAHGELFLIEWSNGNRSIMEAEIYTGRISDPIRWPGQHWWVSPTRPQTVMNLDGSAYMKIRFKDGPWPTAALRDKIIGKIVGLYQPDFRDQFARISA